MTRYKLRTLHSIGGLEAIQRRTLPLMLMMILTLSWVDRLIPGALLEQIRTSLRLTNAEAGAIAGTAFALCQGLAALPLSWVADRVNRRWLIVSATALWSALTLLTGFATSFGDIFLCRMGVGFGEAALLPAGYALLADSFDERSRPKAIATMLLGTPLGTGLALIGGGALFRFFDSRSSFANGEAWRPVFMTIGVLGLCIALSAAWLYEPRRRSQTQMARGRTANQNELTMAKFLMSGPRSFVWTCAGVVACNMFAAGFLFWMAPFYARKFGLSIGQTGASLGIISLIGGLIGSPLAGFVMSRGRGPLLDRSLQGLAISTLSVAVLVPAACMVPNLWLSYGIVSFLLVTTFAATALLPMALVEIAPPALRAQVTATALLGGGVLGTATGPLIVGFGADLGTNPSMALQVSLSLFSAFVLVVGTAMFVLARNGIRQDSEVISCHIVG